VADRPDGRRGDRAAAALGFDPSSVLVRDPGVLLDPHFLAAMRAELAAELEPAQATSTLLQIGFVQGLYDAWRAVADETAGAVVQTPPLAMQLHRVTPDAATGALEVIGCWPEQAEFHALEDPSRVAPHPACTVSAGYTSGWLSGTLDADMLAVEMQCRALGDRACGFVAREDILWRGLDEPRAHAFLDDIPFEAIRTLVRSHVAGGGRAPAQPIDTNAACVHIWDSVMVIPCANGEEALQAVELFGRDPASRKVSVLVVDLAHAVLDEAFGALALEQILRAADRLGLETLLASVSPLAERVVADLERQPIWTHKDLPQAIAAAFQIASSQRRCV